MLYVRPGTPELQARVSQAKASVWMPPFAGPRLSISNSISVVGPVHVPKSGPPRQRNARAASSLPPAPILFPLFGLSNPPVMIGLPTLSVTDVIA